MIDQSLSKHFTLTEATLSQTAARHGIRNEPDELVVTNMKQAAEHLELVREELNTEILVSSWFRCLELEKLIGGSGRPNGHSSGWCIDFTAKGYTPYEVCQSILDAGTKFDQLIFEGTWVHISFHPAMRQMVLTARFAPGKPTVYVKGLQQ